MLNTPYTAAGDQGLTWSLWQRISGETRGQPLGFWSLSYRGPEAHCTPAEKQILAADEGVQATSEVAGTEASPLGTTACPTLDVPRKHHTTSARWSKWVALITQRARMGKPYFLGILEDIMGWPEGRDFGAVPEKVTCAQFAPPTA